MISVQDVGDVTMAVAPVKKALEELAIRSSQPSLITYRCTRCKRIYDEDNICDTCNECIACCECRWTRSRKLKTGFVEVICPGCNEMYVNVIFCEACKQCKNCCKCGEGEKK